MPEIKSVLFVPRTEGGELIKRLRKKEAELAEITEYRVKLVERSGTQIRKILCKKNPFAGQNCFREYCMICKEGGKGDCRRRNITYKTSCNNCRERNAASGISDNDENVASYIGESARSGAERSKEHVEDAKKEKEESHIHKHKLLEHPGEDVHFTMKVIKKHNSCFSRQVHESVLIEMAEKENLLNSKNSFNRCSIPRLTIENSERKPEPIEKDIPESEIADIFEKRKRIKLKQRYKEDNFNCDPPTKRRKFLTKDSFLIDSVCTEKKVLSDLCKDKFDKQHKQDCVPSFPIFTNKANSKQKPAQMKQKCRKKLIHPPKDYKFKSLSSYFAQSNHLQEENPS